MLLLRRIHAYIGFFIAPSVLFFALSGSLQLFDLHEPHGSYRPPALFQLMGSVHKDQVLALAHDRPGPPPSPSPGQLPAGGQPQPARPAQSLSTLLLKWYFLAIALGLAITTGVGLYFGLKATRRPRQSWALLVAGAVIPLGLVFF